MKTSEEYKKAVEIVREQVSIWDPYCIFKNGAPSDELDEEIALVVTGLRTVRSAEDLAAIVSKIFSSRFEDGLFTIGNCLEVSSDMYSQLAAAGLLSNNTNHNP